MIFSENWLREFVDPEVNTEQLAEQLTMAGLEVDSIAPVSHRFTNVVVGLVKSVANHPDAEKLKICHVSTGSESYQVVCGAPNVRADLKVPFAMIGALIVPKSGESSVQIKRTIIRGTESNGMLCSAEELGLSDSSSGLLELEDSATVGADFRKYLQLDDHSIELGLTPNRGDCLGILGLAREVGVLTRKNMKEVTPPQVKERMTEKFPVNISAKDACPRYLGRIIRGIKLNAESPGWIKEKLRRCGLRSIDPVVDVTNYVLLELGQPMHAFDYAKLEGAIEVRFAMPGEKLTLLDGKEVSVKSDTLLIADAKKAVAIAGVMGGLATAVSDTTENVFLECAYFSPLAIAGKARSLGMHTDASHRYERGVDYQVQHLAMARATELLLSIVGGDAGPITEATGNLPEPARIVLRTSAIKQLLGIEIPQQDVHDILTRLGMKLVEVSPTQCTVIVPSYRFDLAIEADLIEELARVYGYNRLPKTAGMMRQVLKSRPETVLDLSRVKHHLVSLGYQEVVTYSFIDPALLAKMKGTSPDQITLQNPISADMSVMRPSLLPGLIGTLKYNQNRQQDRMRLFESGLVFTRVGTEIRQTARIAGLIYGKKYPNNWCSNKELFDFYDLKGDVESFLDFGGKQSGYQFVTTLNPCLHPGQSAEVVMDGKSAGSVGALHPALQRELDIDRAVFLFELNVDAVLNARLARAGELSRYPEVHRDLAIVLDEKVAADKIQTLIRQNAGDYLTDLRIFDVYQGDAVAKSKKSIALGLTWQHPSRTLSDDEINAIISSCVKALQEQFNADLRT